jgi:hypothetical protein
MDSGLNPGVEINVVVLHPASKTITRTSILQELTFAFPSPLGDEPLTGGYEFRRSSRQLFRGSRGAGRNGTKTQTAKISN